MLKVLNKDFGSEFDDLLPGMFSNRLIYDAKLLNEALKVLKETVFSKSFSYMSNVLPLMDDPPFRQTFELGIFISTAEKTILNLEKLYKI